MSQRRKTVNTQIVWVCVALMLAVHHIVNGSPAAQRQRAFEGATMAIFLRAQQQFTTATNNNNNNNHMNKNNNNSNNNNNNSQNNANNNRHQHHLTKRDFTESSCNGIYIASAFERLTNICTDCYNLFREDYITEMCPTNCFNTEYFEGCLQTLHVLEDEVLILKTLIQQLRGSDPIFNGPNAIQQNISQDTSYLYE